MSENSDALPSSTADLIVDYVSRMPASLSNVRSHFGMTRAEALTHLAALEAQGRIRRRGAIALWDVADG